MKQLSTPKQTKREINISIFVNSFDAVKEVFLGRTFLHYRKGDLYCLAMFNQKGFRPVFNYTFSSSEKYLSFFEEQKTRVKLTTDRNLQMLKEYEVKKDAIQKGSVLYSSWGYEQTNIDFYVVLERKKDFITMQEIGQTRDYERQDCGTCMPNETVVIGEPFRKKISNAAHVKLETYKSASLWGGKPKHWSSYY